MSQAKPFLQLRKALKRNASFDSEEVREQTLHLLDSLEQDVEDIVAEDNVSKSYVSMIVKLMLLSPEITEDILNGNQPKHLQLEDFKKPFPYCWTEQKKYFSY